MTIKDLIEELKKHDPDVMVSIRLRNSKFFTSDIMIEETIIYPSTFGPGFWTIDTTCKADKGLPQSTLTIVMR